MYNTSTENVTYVHMYIYVAFTRASRLSFASVNPSCWRKAIWAYERLLLSGAMNAPSSLLSRFLFRHRDRGPT